MGESWTKLYFKATGQWPEFDGWFPVEGSDKNVHRVLHDGDSITVPETQAIELIEKCRQPHQRLR